MTCVGNAGRKLSAQEVGQVAYNAGWRGDDLVNAIAVSFAENGGHYEACYNGICCYGLWQYSRVHGASVAAMTDAQSNADLAYKLWKGSGWGPWTTWPVAAALHKPAARRVAARIDGASASSGTGSGCGQGAGYTFPSACGKLDPTSDQCLACLGAACKKLPRDSAEYNKCLDAVIAASGQTTSIGGTDCGGVLGALACAVSDVEGALKAIAGAFLFLVNPQNWIRVAEVVGGAFLILLAILFLFLYSHRDEVKGIAGSVAKGAM